MVINPTLIAKVPMPTRIYLLPIPPAKEGFATFRPIKKLIYLIINEKRPYIKFSLDSYLFDAGVGVITDHRALPTYDARLPLTTHYSQLTFSFSQQSFCSFFQGCQWRKVIYRFIQIKIRCGRIIIQPVEIRPSIGKVRIRQLGLRVHLQ